jgi:hypothetical protein
MIPILAMNRDKTIWGPDANEFMYVHSLGAQSVWRLIRFSPERWESRSISNSIPGVWGHMLTFLGGPRACIVSQDSDTRHYCTVAYVYARATVSRWWSGFHLFLNDVDG